MTPAGFRRIALGMDGAIESAHMGHPDFRANGKIFATLHADMKHGMVRLSPEQQQAFIRDAPDAFSPEAGAWGRAGCTKVTLKVVSEDALGDAMTLAWQNSATKSGKVEKWRSGKVSRKVKKS
jgi:hypothetical protein